MAFQGIHHIKIPVTDLVKTRDFYSTVLGLKHIVEYDHYNQEKVCFASLMEFEQRGIKMLLELRVNPEQAKRQQHWDPIVWAVQSREDLEALRTKFTDLGLQCSRVLTGFQGWVLGVLDPDAKMVKFYTLDSHEWTTDVDQDDFWL